jgi:hypothetical protein
VEAGFQENPDPNQNDFETYAGNEQRLIQHNVAEPQKLSWMLMKETSLKN